MQTVSYFLLILYIIYYCFLNKIINEAIDIVIFIFLLGGEIGKMRFGKFK